MFRLYTAFPTIRISRVLALLNLLWPRLALAVRFVARLAHAFCRTFIGAH